MIDWMVVAVIVGPIIGAVVGALARRAAERRPKLVTYYGHASSFKVTTQSGPVSLHTHDVVVRNAGRQAATNVRLGHHQLPDFQVHPAMSYNVVDLPDGSKEIVFPKLVPGEQVTVSYLYFPPTTWNLINSYVKSDEGMARFLTVLLQQRYPKWFNISAAVLMLIGLIAVLYFLTLAVLSRL